MKLKYDRAAQIVGIGLVPWTRLGPERWFDNYKIASLYNWDLNGKTNAPAIQALSAVSTPFPKLARLNSQTLLNTPAFQELLIKFAPAHTLLTYRPVKPPKALIEAGFRFPAIDSDLAARVENKATFRAEFADLNLPFPAFMIYDRAGLQADKKTLAKLLDGRAAVMMQDEQLSGGKGSFVVRDATSMQHMLETLSRLPGAGKRVVVSDLITNAHERSVQAVITRYGTFVGPLQKQIVGHPLLANLSVAGGDRFCGGEITPDDRFQAVYPEIKAQALRIGERLQQLGYKGIFGLDCLVSEDGKVFTLEVNLRLTGMTPLLTMLHREGQDIPFCLLHILETMGLDYVITDKFVNAVPPTGALLMLHSQNTTLGTVATAPASGLYNPTDLQLIQSTYRFDEPTAKDQLLVQQYTRVGARIIKPGGRVVSVFTSARALDDNDELLPEAIHTVQSLLDQVSLKKEAIDE